jgi:hypothetical protein
MFGIGRVNTTLKHERRNVTLLKDSMKVTAKREKGKGERRKWPLFEEQLYISTRLEGWAL